MQKIEFSNHQKEYIKNSNKRWNVKTGATRSGKTYLDIVYIIPNRILTVAGKPGLIVFLGYTKGSLQRNIIKPLQEFWGTSLVSDINSQNIAKIFGQEVYCLGASKTTNVEPLRGSSISYCYADEVVSYNKEVFDMLKSRLDKEYSKCDLTCNPENPNHWFKKFMDKQEEDNVDIYVQKYTIDDNPFIPANFVESLKREYSGTVLFERYILGKWVLSEGLVFSNANASNFVTQEFIQSLDFEECNVSLDYGISNATAIILWGLNNGVWYAINELVHSGRDTNIFLTDDEIYNKMDEFIEENIQKNKYARRIIIDPSAKSFIILIKRKDKYKVSKAENDVKNGISMTRSALNLGLIKICDNCKNIKYEFENYRYDDKKNDDTVLKENDHSMDALRYFVYTKRITEKRR